MLEKQAKDALSQIPPLPTLKAPTFEDLKEIDTLLGSHGQNLAQSVVKDIADQDFERLKEHAMEGLKKVGLQDLITEKGLEFPKFFT